MKTHKGAEASGKRRRGSHTLEPAAGDGPERHHGGGRLPADTRGGMGQFAAQQRDAVSGQSGHGVQPGAGAEGGEEQHLHLLLLVLLLLELHHQFGHQTEESACTCRTRRKL